MYAHLRRQREAADAAAQDWQKALAPGDCFYRETAGVAIYGELQDPMGYWRKDLDRDPDFADPEYLWEKDNWARPEMANQRFARCYSTLCPDGELGHAHVASVDAKLTREEFEAARAAGWPSRGAASLVRVEGILDTSTGKFGIRVLLNEEPVVVSPCKWDTVEEAHAAAEAFMREVRTTIHAAGGTTAPAGDPPTGEKES